MGIPSPEVNKTEPTNEAIERDGAKSSHRSSGIPAGVSMLVHVAKNASANWVGLATTMLIAFFLTPFILHRLGDAAFGLWTLMTTVTGYYGILDLGMRNAILRFAARFHELGDEENLNRVASTSIFTYAFLSLVMLLVTGLLSWHPEWIIRNSPQWIHTARVLLLVVGVGTALALPMNVFAGLMEGLQQFTLIGAVQAVSAVVRGALVVVLLANGYGLLGLAGITVVISFLGYVVYGLMVFRLLPRLKLNWTHFDKATLKTMSSFGLVTCWNGVSERLRFQADSLVIAAFLSIPAISFFAVGSRLVMYSGEIVDALAQVFTPMSSRVDARGDVAQMRRVLIVGNRYCSFLMFPIAVVLLVLGRAFLRVWVGPAYVSSYSVLAVLTIPTALYTAQSVSMRVLYGMAQQRILARVLLLEGLANLLLSIILLRWYGILGVALGTAIPLMFTSVFFFPLHLCRLLKLPLGRYVREAHLYPLLLSLPPALAVWLSEGLVHAHTYPGLFIELCCGGVVYGVEMVVYYYWKEHPDQVRFELSRQATERSAILTSRDPASLTPDPDK